VTDASANINAVHRNMTAAVDMDSYRALATALLREAKRDAMMLSRLSAFAVTAVRVGRWMRLKTVAASATLAQLAVQIQGRCNKRRGFRELNALDDRILKDIGIGRSEILHLVHCSRQTYRRNEF
jgi:uncharacterized protein YjiS (DUF1127 family)